MQGVHVSFYTTKRGVMDMLRRREIRQEAREERATPTQPPGQPMPGAMAAGGAQRYVMREKMFSIGDDFFIQNGVGQRAFRVDAKALRVRDTLKFEDMQGRELATIQERKAAIKDTMTIEKNGQPFATVKKAMITPLRERFTVNTPAGEIEIKGNILDHEYTFDQNGRVIAEVSKKWVRMRDTYTIDVQPGQDDIVILAAAIAVEAMAS
jgi:uncharacterized protein YxjI